MPRVALVFGSFRGGGVARVMLRLAGALTDRGVDTHLIVGRCKGELIGEVPTRATVHALTHGSTVGTYARILRADHRAACGLLRAVGSGQPVTTKLRFLASLQGTLAALRPDAVLAATAPFNMISLWANTLNGGSARVIITEHNILTRPDRGEESWRYGLPPALLGAVYPRADAIVGVSTGVAEDLRSAAGLDAGQISVVYNPVFDQTLAKRASEPVSHPWFADGESPVIIGVGKLYAPGKNFAMLIRAFAHVRQQRPSRLIILGDTKGAAVDDPVLPEVLNLPQQLGIADDVAFPGFVDNPFAWMRRSKVFALSSRWEGLPLVLIEALATGCPVVSTDCPHGPREILEDGRYGPLVPVGDDAALAAAIVATLDAPPGVDLLRQRASAFTVENSIEGYLRLMLPGSPALAS